MDSLSSSVVSSLEDLEPHHQRSFCVTKHTKIFRQQLHRLWQSVDSSEDASKGTTVEDIVAVILSPSRDVSWLSLAKEGLTSLDSSACAALFKELGRNGKCTEAFEIFDWLRGLDASHELTRLLDVYTYTTMIAQCATGDKWTRASELIQDMRRRSIPCNVHTYSALLHVYAKTDQTDLALGIPDLMKKDGCMPNLVTFNTLINLFRKMGEWKKAVEVIDIIDNMNIHAEAKTYNSVISACSSCGEPAQALYVYRRMLAKSVQPSAATYTALISAHGKRGLVDEALAIFRDMIQRGCPRNVITYSSLIGACERSGQWQLAFDLFGRMKSEGIQPNIITFNSLLTACANSGQWSKACDVYAYMLRDGCRPDPTTYTTLLSALIKGEGYWTAALAILEDITRNGYSRPDGAIFNAVMEILWASGENTAQIAAVHIWKTAQRTGNLKFVIRSQGTEFSTEVFTCGTAVITVLVWLMQLKSCVVTGNEITLLMKCGRRSSIEQDTMAIKDAVTGVLRGIRAPFIVCESEQTIKVTSTVGMKERAEWFAGNDCKGLLCTLEEVMSTPPLTTSLLLESFKTKADRCTSAYQSVLSFEAGNKMPHSVQQNVDLAKDRSSIVHSALFYADVFGFSRDTALDAVWLLDRLYASGMFTHQYLNENHQILICVCVLSIESSMKTGHAFSIPQESGFQLEDLVAVKMQIQRALDNDMRGVSPMRILSLFGELLGGCTPFRLFLKDEHNFFRSVISCIAQHPSSLQLPSSLLACCILYEARRVHCIYPYWPTELKRITGYTSNSIKDMLGRFPAVTDIVMKQSFLPL